MTVTLKPLSSRWTWSCVKTTSSLTPRISTLARKQGFNTLKSTAQWTWINITGAHSYIKACTDANFQAISCFSLAYSVVYFDIRGNYQLCYSYLACLSVEHTSITTETLRIGAAILEEHQVLSGLQLQQPHDLHTGGGFLCPTTRLISKHFNGLYSTYNAKYKPYKTS